jgi:hypothetical protein
MNSYGSMKPGCRVNAVKLGGDGGEGAEGIRILNAMFPRRSGASGRFQVRQ